LIAEIKTATSTPRANQTAKLLPHTSELELFSKSEQKIGEIIHQFNQYGKGARFNPTGILSCVRQA